MVKAHELYTELRKNFDGKRMDAGSHFHLLTAFLRGSDQRKLAHNTWVVRPDNDTVAIILHTTRIVTIQRGEYIDRAWTTPRTFVQYNVTINTGGYHTVTTKQRLNQFSPITVWQKNYQWYTGGLHNPYSRDTLDFSRSTDIKLISER